MQIAFVPFKAAANEHKHGVSFEEAASSLLDENALAMEDDCEGEHRWIVLGMSARGRLLVVVYTLREETVRLISARKATKNETGAYEN
ncbi:BrnT family toxin [Tahibacter soli]|uniref:BrnT family toxin n=1 Tax=Tahibacter soli TaxID=2983605 RepID=A0A9X4BG26_9GAMM|nr:BrnT family toxin [Tahibacter soli]MDC8010931.1 BrnT family toxin [Tahibacter soli]